MFPGSAVWLTQVGDEQRGVASAATCAPISQRRARRSNCSDD